MSDEPTVTEPTEEPTPQVEEAEAEVDNETAEVQEETTQTDETVETTETEEEPSDLVSEALAEQERLKAELEALKTQEGNVFEENAKLKAELEEAQKAADLAKENDNLKAQLEGIKRDSLTKQLIAQGAITKDMEEWADGLSFDQLQAFADKAPKRKTILDQKNNGAEDKTPLMAMQEWKKTQNKSRIM